MANISLSKKKGKSARSIMLRKIMGKLSGGNGAILGEAIQEGNAKSFAERWEKIGKEIEGELENKKS